MTVTFEEVHDLLSADKPEYKAAARWGVSVLPILEELIATGESVLACKAICLAGLIGGKRAERIVQNAAQHTHPQMRYAAALACKSLPSAAAAAVVEQLLSDVDPSVCLSALSSCTESSLKRLKSVIEKCSIDKKQQSAIRSLAKEILETTGACTSAITNISAKGQTGAVIGSLDEDAPPKGPLAKTAICGYASLPGEVVTVRRRDGSETGNDDGMGDID